MRILGLISWYDEHPAWLAATVTSLHKTGIDHIIAVDGAYALYPNSQARSTPDQHATIQHVCDALGIGCTIHTPQDRWWGNETEKRTFMFTLADTISEPGDWHMIMDADQIISVPLPDLKHQLEHTEHDVAEVTFIEPTPLPAQQARQHDLDPVSQYPVRILFRAHQGLHCHGNHYTYRTADGRTLWGNPTSRRALEPCLDLRHLQVQHRTHQRTQHRQNQKRAYYKTRDELGVERTTCEDCGQPATTTVPHSWELTPHGPAAGSLVACDECADRITTQGRKQLAEWGYDLDTLKPSAMKV